MDKLSFNIFPNVNFIDLCMYQFGHEQCEPGHSFGPATRNHYLFHYVLSGTGTLMADNAKGITQTYNIKSGQGFLIFPGQINTYIADDKLPWEYIWIEFDGLRVKEALTTTELTKNNPVYHTHSKDIREKLVAEMLYITRHPSESPYHLIGHMYLFLDYLMQSAKSSKLVPGGKMSDFYIKEAMNYIEQNFQNDISIEEIARSLRHKPKLSGQDFQKFSWTFTSGISHELSYDKGHRTFKADLLIHRRCWFCRWIRKSASFLTRL